MLRVATYTLLAVVLIATSAAAQAMQQAPPGPRPPSQQSQPSAAPADAQQMMDMCRQMHAMMHGGGMQGDMHGMMHGGGMMGGMPMMGGGMMGGAAPSPQMMQMRGEMLKAMGDIMLKYGKQMEGTGK